MKFFTVILLTMLSASCTSEVSSEDVNTSEDNVKQPTLESVDSTSLRKEKVRQAIMLAKQNKDYRLLVTSGRSPSVPGVDVSNFQILIELCGKKYNPAAGDVITSQEQRVTRKKQVAFMRQYNEQMLVVCQENSMN
jgi:hypothetical protein